MKPGGGGPAHGGGIIPGGGNGPQGGGMKPGGGMKLAGSSGGAKDDLGGGMMVMVESPESESSSFFDGSSSCTRLMMRIFSLLSLRLTGMGLGRGLCRKASSSSSGSPPHARSLLACRTRSSVEVDLQKPKLHLIYRHKN